MRAFAVNFVSQVETMVQTGNFKFDYKPVVAAPKHDKKQVSVWKLPDGVSKPDFRHWLDSVDIQLEAIHGFIYHDLVSEKIERLPTIEQRGHPIPGGCQTLISRGRSRHSPSVRALTPSKADQDLLQSPCSRPVSYPRKLKC